MNPTCIRVSAVVAIPGNGSWAITDSIWAAVRTNVSAGKPSAADRWSVNRRSRASRPPVGMSNSTLPLLAYVLTASSPASSKSSTSRRALDGVPATLMARMSAAARVICVKVACGDDRTPRHRRARHRREQRNRRGDGARPRGAGIDRRHRGRRGDRLDDLAARIAADGGRAVGLEADITDPDAAAGVVAQTVEEAGRLDIVVNNAGVMLLGPRWTRRSRSGTGWST